MKFEIKVTQINDDGTKIPFFFDAMDTISAIECEGFAILGMRCEGGSNCVAIHNTNVLDIATAMASNDRLRSAGLLAPVMSKIGMELDEDAAE